MRKRIARNRRLRIGLGTLLLLVIAAIAVVGVPSALADQNAPAAIAAVTQTPGEVTVTNTSGFDAEAYWTPQRMAAAKPYDIARQGSPNASDTGAGPTSAPGGGGGSLPGGREPVAGPPVPTSNSQSSNPVPTDGPFPGPHSTWPWFGNYLRYPISTIGRLFFTPAGGGSASCSAATTSGGSGTPQNVVWTAGHCISNGAGAFHSNWSFCPSFNNNPHPQRGCWGWTSATVRNEWHFSGDFRRDLGYLTTTNSNNVWNAPPGAVVGTLGFAWNFARDQHWMDFGYPAEAGCCGWPWTGGFIGTTAAEHRFDDGSNVGAPAANSIGSGLTRGASGGPWLLNFQGGYAGAPWINSTNSYTYCVNTNCTPANPNDQNGREMYGPYYDTLVCNFWKGGTAWPGTC